MGVAGAEVAPEAGAAEVQEGVWGDAVGGSGAGR